MNEVILEISKGVLGLVVLLLFVHPVMLIIRNAILSKNNKYALDEHLIKAYVESDRFLESSLKLIATRAKLDGWSIPIIMICSVTCSIVFVAKDLDQPTRVESEEYQRIIMDLDPGIYSKRGSEEFAIALERAYETVDVGDATFWKNQDSESENLRNSIKEHKYAIRERLLDHKDRTALFYLYANEPIYHKSEPRGGPLSIGWGWSNLSIFLFTVTCFDVFSMMAFKKICSYRINVLFRYFAILCFILFLITCSAYSYSYYRFNSIPPFLLVSLIPFFLIFLTKDSDQKILDVLLNSSMWAMLSISVLLLLFFPPHNTTLIVSTNWILEFHSLLVLCSTTPALLFLIFLLEMLTQVVIVSRVFLGHYFEAVLSISDKFFDFFVRIITVIISVLLYRLLFHPQ